MKIAIFAAGTGGHIFPALSIAKEYDENDVIFFASNREIEKQIYIKIGVVMVQIIYMVGEDSIFMTILQIQPIYIEGQTIQPEQQHFPIIILLMLKMRLTLVEE